MKRNVIFAIGIVAILSASIAYARVQSVYLRYENKDSKTYYFNVKIGGSTTQVEFGGSRTASVTIQGGGESAVIETQCGSVTVQGNDVIEIKNGCIIIKNR